jgi:hypothetical protein
LKGKSVTYVSGMKCYPCLGLFIRSHMIHASYGEMRLGNPAKKDHELHERAIEEAAWNSRDVGSSHVLRQQAASRSHTRR